MNAHETMEQQFYISVYQAPYHPHLWNIRFVPKTMLWELSSHEIATRVVRVALVIVDTSESLPNLVFVPGDWQDVQITPADYKNEALWQIAHRRGIPPLLQNQAAASVSQAYKGG